jgi:hypothetical protein
MKRSFAVLLLSCAPQGASALRPIPPAPIASSAAASGAAPPAFSFARKSAAPISGAHATSKGRVIAFTEQQLLQLDPSEPHTAVRHSVGPSNFFAFSETGDRFLLVNGEGFQVWSTEPVQKLRTVTLPGREATKGVLSPDGSRIAIHVCGASMSKPQAQKASPAVTTGCEFALYKSDGSELYASIGANDAKTEAGFSQDGGYFIVGSEDARCEFYDAASGALRLKRQGVYVSVAATGAVLTNPGSVLHIGSDRLVLSRNTMLELDDLKTGKVLRSKRYPGTPGSNDGDGDPFTHTIVKEQSLVATLDRSGESLLLWNYNTGAASSVDLRPQLSGPCECTIAEVGGIISVVGSDLSGLMHLAYDPKTARTSVDRTTRPVRVGEKWRILTSLDNSACWLEGTEETAKKRTSIPKAFCADPGARGSMVWASHGGLHVGRIALGGDAPKLESLLEYGRDSLGKDSMHVTGTEGQLTFTDSEHAKEVILAPAKKTRPWPTTRGIVSVKDTARFRFVLQHAGSAGFDLLAYDGQGREVLHEPFAFDLYGRDQALLASGAHAVVSARPPYRSLVCEVGKGCTAQTIPERTLALRNGILLLLPSDQRSPALMNVNSLEQQELPVPPCSAPLSLLPFGKTVQTLCTEPGAFTLKQDTDATARLFVVDAAGHVAPGASLQGHALSRSNSHVAFGQLALLSQEGGTLTTYSLVHRDQGYVGELHVGLDGALATYQDGTIERFGDTTAVATELFCERGNKLFALSHCTAGRERPGKLRKLAGE